MNTTVTSYSSEHSWTSRRFSIESVLSIQGKDTDVVCDTSDTESRSDRDAEYEPVSASEDEGPVAADSSGESDADLIKTRVLEVVVRGERSSDGDAEPGSDGSDSELDLHDYWRCAQCRAANNNPLYRYCERCFKVRKNFFPPRPKRKAKVSPRAAPPPPVRTLDTLDSGIDSAVNSQDLSQTLDYREPAKRRAESADRDPKRARLGDDPDQRPRQARSEDRKAGDVAPLVKTVSDPALTVTDPASNVDDKNDLCIVCFSEPKSGVFVHGRIAHICCCYKCSVKVWARAKRCPVCNCKVSNVLRAVVM